MKTIKFQLKPYLVLAIATLFFTSCSDDSNDVLINPPVDASYEIIVNPDNAQNQSERNITLEAAPNSKVDVKVTFTGNENMYRLYTAKNEYGVDDSYVPYEFSVGDKKADGSIDISKDGKETFTYTLPFDAPTTDNGVVVYTLWATTGRGDFRDVSKRNAISDRAIGTVTIKGNPNASATAKGFKSFSAVLLAAPLQDGSSKTFISLFDNQVYAINQGEEYAALWDFGYYYGKTHQASLASAADYPSSVVDIKTIAKVTTDDLNTFYFKRAEANVDFDAVASKEDLDYITKPSNQTVTMLSKDNVVEFVDAYGNKGLIKVTEIKGDFGVGDYIKFDVKVQVNAQPFKL